MKLHSPIQCAGFCNTMLTTHTFDAKTQEFRCPRCQWVSHVGLLIKKRKK